MRFLALIGLLVISAVAQAQNSFGSFEWNTRGSSKFELQFVQNGKGVSIKGDMFEDWANDKTEVSVTDQGYVVYLKAYAEGFVYAVVSEEKNLEAPSMVFLMELQNGFYVGMMKPAVMARTSTVMNDVPGILKALKTLNGWDVAISMRSMREYFEANPNAQLSGFFDAVEAGQIKTIPRPRIDSGAVDNGVVQLPEETTRPPKIAIDEPVVEQPAVDQPGVDVNGDGLVMPEEPVEPPVDGNNPDGLTPPADIPNDGFVPKDMTEGWDGDEAPVVDQNQEWLEAERARQAAERKKRRPVVVEQPLDIDDDLF